MELERCTALMDGKCRNGFPTDAVCQGFGGELAVPLCMDERRTARLFPDTGAPQQFDRFRKENAP